MERFLQFCGLHSLTPKRKREKSLFCSLYFLTPREREREEISPLWSTLTHSKRERKPLLWSTLPHSQREEISLTWSAFPHSQREREREEISLFCGLHFLNLTERKRTFLYSVIDTPPFPEKDEISLLCTLRSLISCKDQKGCLCGRGGGRGRTRKMT